MSQASLHEQDEGDYSGWQVHDWSGCRALT